MGSQLDISLQVRSPLISSCNLVERSTASSPLGDIPCSAHPKRYHICRTRSEGFPRDMAAILAMLHVPWRTVEVCCSSP